MTTTFARLAHDARDPVTWDSVNVWVRVALAPGSRRSLPQVAASQSVRGAEDANLGAPRSSDLFQGLETDHAHVPKETENKVDGVPPLASRYPRRHCSGPPTRRSCHGVHQALPH